MVGERVFNIGKRSGKGTWGDRRGTQDLTERRERRSGLTFWYVQAAEGRRATLEAEAGEGGMEDTGS